MHKVLFLSYYKSHKCTCLLPNITIRATVMKDKDSCLILRFVSWRKKTFSSVLLFIPKYSLFHKIFSFFSHLSIKNHFFDSRLLLLFFYFSKDNVSSDRKSNGILNSIKWNFILLTYFLLVYFEDGKPGIKIGFRKSSLPFTHNKKNPFLTVC